MYMAQAALTQWIEYLTDKKQEIPTASDLKMDDQVSEAGLSLSRVLQDALKEKLNVG